MAGNDGFLWLRTAGDQPIKVERARTFWRRLRGLLGRKDLPATEGLLLEPCSSVHTLGMRFPIDVVFLAADDRVLAIYRDVPPGRVNLRAKNARRVLELAAGAAKLLPCFPGERLIFTATVKK